MKQALDFIKAHTTALACAVVALLAILAFFIYPIPGMIHDLQTEVAAREKTHQAIDALLKEQRTLPVLDPKSSEPQPLNVFPTQPVITAGTDAVKILQQQVKDYVGEWVKLTERPPLVRNALPSPQPLVKGTFKAAYDAATAQTGEAAKNGIIHTVLKGTLPPTAEELRQTEEQRTQDIVNKLLQRDARGQPTNQPDVDAAVADMRAKLPLEQRLARAQQNQIYVSPDAVGVQPELRSKTSTSDLNAIDIFNAQYSLWLQTTLFEAIADANAGSKNVLDAPVKHLVRLTVPLNIIDPQFVTQSAGGGGQFGAPTAEPEAPPPALTPDASATITPNYAQSPLGYAANSFFDPIRCDLVLRVDYRRLPEVLTKLTATHLVKIRNLSYRTVESGVALGEGYLYDADGRTPLVEVTLDVEVLMLRQWVLTYMPDAAKRTFANHSSPTPVPG